MSMKRIYFLKILTGIILTYFICEFLIYYVVLIQCSWPNLDPEKADMSVPVKNVKHIKVMLLADTHLLGSRRGHWFDKLRREWQMFRTFQTAMTLHAPDVIFVLGDLFDEGLGCGDAEFSAYIERFHSLFHVPRDTRIFVVPGNHDIGFHYGITQYLQERFSQGFDAPPVRMLSISGNHFVLINSMALEGDGCFLCRPAEIEITKIANTLKCTKDPMKCKKEKGLKIYSRPIILQHFPLYRESDEQCNEPDEAPEDEKKQKFRERWECLSKESSDMLLESLNPRLVIDGHTHHGCHIYHSSHDAHEFTVPSFSWRNKDNPSFILAVFTPNNFAISKCHMPRESTVYLLYAVGIFCILLYAALSYKFHCRKNRVFKVH